MWSTLRQLNWTKIGFAATFLLSGGLFVAAAYSVMAPGTTRLAVTLATAGVVVAVLASRLFGNDVRYLYGRPILLVVSWSGAAVALVYGISEATPSGPPRQFVWFFGLGIVAVFLGWWFSRDGMPFRRRADAERPQDRDTRWTQAAVLTWCYVGGVGLLLFAIRAVVPVGNIEAMFRILGVGIMLGGGAFLAGALLGFLFGIPRAQAPTPVEKPQGTTNGNKPQENQPETQTEKPNNAQRDSKTTFLVNTNLEQISDWLTKIIVGLGLIHLRQMPEHFRGLSTYFSTGFGNVEGRESLTLALIILFLVSGFLLGYLLTRLFLTGAFVRAEDSVSAFDRAVEGLPLPPPPPPGGIGGLGGLGGTPPPGGTQALAAATQRASEAASSLEPSQIRSKVQDLAEQYNYTRAAMSFTPERTQRLDAIANKMKIVHKSAYFMLSELAHGTSAGERLAAIVFLVMRPDPAYLNWLVERFTNEQPFLLFYAAQALRAAADSLRTTHKKEVSEAVDSALKVAPKSDKPVYQALSEAQSLVRVDPPPGPEPGAAR